MHRRILGLTALEAALAACGLLVVGRQAVTPLPSATMLGVFAVVFAVLAMLPRVQVEFKGQACCITPADCVLLVALVWLGPIGFVVATMLGELPAAARHHRMWLKTAFNFVHMLGGYVAGALIVGLAGQPDALDPRWWLVGAGALTAIAAWDLVSTAAVLAISDGQPFREVAAGLMPPAVTTLLASTMLGIAALVLSAQSLLGPLLFAPVFAILFVSTHGVAHQRAERMRFERLYEASSELTQLVSLPDMLTLIATEGRRLLTGVAGACCTVDADGVWTGRIVVDGPSTALTDTAMAALRELTTDRRRGEIASTDLPTASRRLLPACSSLAWAYIQRGEAAAPLLLVVFRQLTADERHEHRAEVLDAFATHAAAVVANVGLHEEVQAALQRQVALNQQKSDFVAAVSHELRTPLTAMIGAVQTVRRLADRLPPEERDRVLEMGMSQGARLKSLIEDLLLVAAADHHEIKVARDPVSLPALFASLGDELRPLVGQRLQLAASAPSLVAVGDEEKLRRILINLVDNARKYAPDGPIEVTAERTGGDVTIAVTDHGPGIPAADRERIFERFVQLDQSSTRRQGGTGLGLSLCRELAHRLDGSLEVGEAPSGGARFVLRMPAHAAVASDGEATLPSLPVGMARSPMHRPVGTHPVIDGIARQRPAAMARPDALAADGTAMHANLAIAREGCAP